MPKIHPPTSIQTDFRPISLTPTLCKILESFVGRWLLQRIGAKLDPFQFGTLRGRSTSHALVSIIDQWARALDGGESVRAVFVDFTKAFDRMDHTLLLNKMLTLGAPIFLVEWMFSFLKGYHHRVKINGHISEWREPTAGMPQGTWLGPLSFIILINDLKTSCPTHKFVDDVTLTEILPSTTMPSAMQHFLSELHLWSSANFMQINHNKTKEITLGPLARRDLDPLVVGGNNIERVFTFKLLGVHIDSDLRWNTHIDALAKRVNSRLYTLKQLKRSGLRVSFLNSSGTCHILLLCSFSTSTPSIAVE